MGILNIHLIKDQSFINQFRQRFEKFYPNSNIFLINDTSESLKYTNNFNELCVIDYKDLTKIDNYIKRFIEKKTEINLFVHFLGNHSAELANSLKKILNLKTYWIFYGSDLYTPLYKKGKYKLYDKELDVFNFLDLNKTKEFLFRKFFGFQESLALLNFIRELDYFCFWNEFDYALLMKNFETNAIFIPFIYDTFNVEKSILRSEGKQKLKILVNHSGSKSGNHIWILNKLDKLKVHHQIDKMIVPLNYGDDYIIQSVLKLGRKKWNNIFSPLNDFLKKDEYFQMLNNIDIAFFGHRRQEAGGNLLFLIASGAKVYLRNSNNLLQYFRDLGIKIFDFDKDYEIGQLSELNTLARFDQQKNREIILEKFSEKKVDQLYSTLVQ